MKIRNEKEYKRKKRHRRVRKKVVGTPDRPRLCVFRSLRHIYAQVIDDTRGEVLVAASSLKVRESNNDKKTSGKMLHAKEVGKMLADRAKEKGITKVTFDRNGYLYHGRIAALAESARENGLEF